METINITTFSKNGNLTRNRSLIKDAIKYYDSKIFTIVFKPKKKESSDPQRKYYFVVIIPIIMIAIRDSWGEIWSKEKTNDFLKLQFAFKEKVNESTGEFLRIPQSPTHDMSTTEREDYHTQCRELAKEWFNVEIPLPNEDLQINYED